MMSELIRLALVGIGKIARDQHLPAIAGSSRFALVATASHSEGVDGVPHFSDIETMLRGGHGIEAVSVATPPCGRYAIARSAIESGCSVMLEKPPGLTLGEVEDLARRASARRVTLYTSWHSRSAAAVERAGEWIAERVVHGARITWREDIRKWHPGQDWIMEAGGFGVFDPAINAFSIATHILPDALIIEDAELDIPENRGAPIAARLMLRHGDAPIAVDLDFLQTGPQAWEIEVVTDRGTLLLRDGGQCIEIDGEAQAASENQEYPDLYQRFAALIRDGKSSVDVEPLRIVADAMLAARVNAVPAFHF